MTLSARAAFVTGGTGALGQAVARRFLRDGYRVAVTYRSEKEWHALRDSESGAVPEGRLVGIPADVTSMGSVGDAVGQASNALGGLTVLAHIAGGYAGGTPVEKLDEEAVRGMMDLNLISAFWAARHTVPHLRASGAGRLLFVSSRGALDPAAGAAPYAAAKLGLHALVGALARELHGSGVTVNAVLPSIIDTAANRAAMPRARHETWVRPEAVADLLAYLASEAAAATSGALIPIYGDA